MKNIFLKIIISIPSILISLYFIPILGISLILLRFICNQRKIYVPIILIGTGLILLLPTILNYFFDLSKVENLYKFINSKTYQVNVIEYSKLLLIIGVIFLILYFVFEWLLKIGVNFLKFYIGEIDKNSYEISKENDLIIKEKQIKAKNTNVIYCPYCGADNILTSNIGTCKYCRRKIKVKK